ARDRRLHAGAAHRAPPGHAGHDRPWPRRRVGGHGARRPHAADTDLARRRPGRCPLPGDRPGVRAAARRVAQRRHPGRSAPARLHPGGRQQALAPCGPAGDRRRDAAQDGPPGPTRAAPARRASDRARRRRLVRLDAGLHLAHPPGGARPLAAALCRVPTGVGGRRAGPAGPAVGVRSIYDNGIVTDAYAAAGVDTRQADRGVSALVAVLNSIQTGRERLSVPLSGHYASVIKIAPNLGIALATDSVGSKVIVAEQARRFSTIGIDCVAMNVNDLICVGAEPLALLDYIAVESADPELLADLAEGLRAGAEDAGVEIPGGEVCQLPEVIRGHPSPYGFDLVGSAFGTVALDAIVDGRACAAGDALIGLPASGVHSNGLTLARRVLLEDGGLSLDARPEALAGASVADVL